MIYEIKSATLTAKINTLGAELISVVNETGTEFIYQPSDLWIGQAKNQFPNVAITKDDIAIMKGKEYPVNQHGFLKLMELEATPIAENEIVFALQSNEETRKWYPYEFTFTIRFCIEGNQMHQTYVVENRDADTMYFGVSCHTGYNTAAGSYVDLGANDALIEMIRPNRYLMSGEEAPFVMPDGKMSVCPAHLGDGARILRGFQNKQITLVNPALGSAVEFDFSDFPYLTLWSTDDASEFVCMMPWHALPDYLDTNQIFEEKKGNTALPAGEQFAVTQHFTFKSL